MCHAFQLLGDLQLALNQHRLRCRPFQLLGAFKLDFNLQRLQKVCFSNEWRSPSHGCSSSLLSHSCTQWGHRVDMVRGKVYLSNYNLVQRITETIELKPSCHN
jgi:hypothetical protein